MHSFQSSHRRRFVQTMSAGLAAGATVGSWWEPAPCRGSEHRSLGVAITGLGHSAMGLLLPALQQTQQCHLAAVATGNAAKGKAIAARWDLGAEHVYDYAAFDQIAHDPAVDIVCVALPNHLHEEFTVRAAAAGKHVFCLKPLANTTAQGARMMAACEAAGRSLAVGYGALPWRPEGRQRAGISRDAAAWIEAGLGWMPPTAAWRYEHHQAGGGALLDHGTVLIQSLRKALRQDPISVTAQETKRDFKRFRDVDESMTWAMNFADGLVAHCRVSFSRHENYVRLTSKPLATEKVTTSPATEKLGIDALSCELDTFATSLLAGQVNRSLAVDGLRNLEIVDAIYRSAREGTTIAVS